MLAKLVDSTSGIVFYHYISKQFLVKILCHTISQVAKMLNMSK